MIDADVEETERVKRVKEADAAEELLDTVGQHQEIERDAGM